MCPPSGQTSGRSNRSGLTFAQHARERRPLRAASAARSVPSSLASTSSSAKPVVTDADPGFWGADFGYRMYYR